MPKRLAQVAVLLLTTLVMLGAGTPSTRFDRIGHKLMCPCGCAEILLECNHVGCPDSERMIGELKSQLGGGPGSVAGGSSAASATDTSILNWFADKYGPTVLAAPMRGGFDRVAWIMPFAVLGLGIVGAIWLLRHWRERHAQTAALAAPGGPAFQQSSTDLRDRIRQETTYEP